MSHNNLYKEFRCQSCNKLLFKGVLIESEIEVKCKRCDTISIFNGVSADSFICFVENCPGRVTKVAKK